MKDGQATKLTKVSESFIHFDCWNYSSRFEFPKAINRSIEINRGNWVPCIWKICILIMGEDSGEIGFILTFTKSNYSKVVYIKAHALLLPQVRVEPIANAAPVGKKLPALAGTVKDLPEEFAENHDRYIHGAPNRSARWRPSSPIPRISLLS